MRQRNAQSRHRLQRSAVRHLRCQTNGEQFYLNGLAEAGVNGFPRGNVTNRYFTWQPRIGFTYDIAGNGRTVIRGGVGMFYERVQGNDVYNAALNPPFAYQPSGNNVMFSNPNTSALTGATTSQSFPVDHDHHQVQLSAAGHCRLQPRCPAPDRAVGDRRGPVRRIRRHGIRTTTARSMCCL